MNSHNRRKANNPIKKKIQADDLHKNFSKENVQMTNIYRIGSLTSLILTYCLMLSCWLPLKWERNRSDHLENMGILHIV